MDIFTFVEPGFAKQLRVLTFSELMEDNPLRAAADDLRACANRFHVVGTKFPSRLLGDALWLMDEYRPYCFERHTGRWPDGKFRMLGRGYRLWRGHEIALAGDALVALGLDRWYKSRGCVVGVDLQRIKPLADDDLWHAPTRWKLVNLAGLMQQLSEALQ